MFEVDRLAGAYSRSSESARVWQRRYRASATVTLLSIPVFSRADVGAGFTVIEDGAAGDTNTVAIQFGAGSSPETAHGLNRLGYIQEVVIDNRAGEIAECAYFAFMTSSQEKNLDQAKKALGIERWHDPLRGGGRDRQKRRVPLPARPHCFPFETHLARLPGADRKSPHRDDE